MVTCRDICNLKLDGVELLAGENGLNRIVSWFFPVHVKTYKECVSRGNFALITIDNDYFNFDEAIHVMEELNEFGISGLAVSVVTDKEAIPQRMIDKAEELKLPLFLIHSLKICVLVFIVIILD